MRLLVLVGIFLSVTLNVVCQDTTQITPRSKIKEEFKQHRDSTAGKWLNADTIASHARQLSDEQFRTTMAMEKQKQNEIEEDSYAIQHRKRSFDFQYNASIGIFIMVIAIVITGLVFSGWQFNLAIKQLKVKEALIKTSAATTGGDDTTPPVQGAPAGENNALLNALKSEVELSSTGIKANSSVLGVIILVLSIAFFYLYLIYVYPVKYLVPSVTGGKADSTIVGKEK